MAQTKLARTGNALKPWALCALLVSVGLGTAACDQTQKTRQVIDQRATEAQQTLDSSKTATHPVDYNPLTVTHKVWGGNAALRMQRGMPLPARYEVPRGVTIVSADPMNLNDLAEAISAQTGIPIRLNSLSLTNGKSAAIAAAAPTLPSAFPNQLTPTAVAAPAPVATSSSSGPTMQVSYEGPLSGLLERIGAHFGVSWHYDGSTISISRYETRIFTVEALPGTQQINEGMQDDTSSNNGGGASSNNNNSGGSSSTTSTSAQNTLTQNSKSTIDFKYWDELSQVLNSIVGSQGAVVTSPTMGTVTVTTTADVMATVSDYLSKENKRLSRQIAINVQIYSVNLGQSEDFSVQFSAFLKNLTKFSGFNYSSASGPAIVNTSLSSANLGQLSVAVLNGPNDPTAHVGDIFNALSTIGDTTSVAQFPMTTLNNHPVSRRVGTDTSYVQSVTQNTTTSTSSNTILTPIIGTIHDGFSLQLTPRLLDDGRMLLQYSLSLIGLDSLGATTFSGLPLDLPVTNNRIFVQQSMLRSGQTLMIGGVDQENMTQDKQGVGSPDNFLLGGGVSSQTTHFMLFMAITPQVMDDVVDEERQ